MTNSNPCAYMISLLGKLRPKDDKLGDHPGLHGRILKPACVHSGPAWATWYDFFFFLKLACNYSGTPFQHIPQPSPPQKKAQIHIDEKKASVNNNSSNYKPNSLIYYEWDQLNTKRSHSQAWMSQGSWPSVVENTSWCPNGICRPSFLSVFNSLGWVLMLALVMILWKLEKN